ncbi:hypothetical protein F4814DRAFT_451185 [Daldinia grandis]|nr:hypothetical protein F4814DRAFT_451185 [Daldinia grandis]
MGTISVFRARYTDEVSLYEHLRKVLPTGEIQISFKRGRFHCTIPRPLTSDELDGIQLALDKDHYER